MGTICELFLNHIDHNLEKFLRKKSKDKNKDIYLIKLRMNEVVQF